MKGLETQLNEEQFFNCWKFCFQQNLKEIYNAEKQMRDMSGWPQIGFDDFCLRIYKNAPVIAESPNVN